jgi:mannose-1-phosphate guanylyltransferase
MKAMILAAGLGTRLDPLTKIRPKPLFPVLNRPLLGITVEQLRGMGATAVIINAHHLADQVEQFMGGEEWGLKAEVRVEPEILGTGGGIKNCADFLQDTPFFIVVNADVYYTFDLIPAIHYHRESDNLATLVLCDHPRFNQVGIDGEGRIVSVGEKSITPSTSETQLLTFTGIHIISPKLLDSMPSVGFFGIMEVYMELVSRGEAIRGYQMQEGDWRDIGRVEDYMDLHRDLLRQKGEPVIDRDTSLAGDVRIEGFVCIGKGTHIKAGSIIKDSIIWDGVWIEEGSIVEDCIVGDRMKVKGQHRREVLIPG